jgi:biotin transport system permease protein
MIGVYVPGATALHRMGFLWKLAALGGVAVALARTADWRALALACVATLALYAALGRPFLRRLADLRPLWPMLVTIAALQAYFESPAAAAAAVARMLALVALANLVTYTTTTSAMVEALETAFRPLRFFGVNPRAPALAVALTLRFVPTLLGLWEEKTEAWRARTGRRASARLIPSFLAEALRLADDLALALDARGFSLAAPKSSELSKSPSKTPSSLEKNGPYDV